MKLLLKYLGELRKCTIIDRPNRFTLRARVNSSTQQVYLPNPGKLTTVLAPGRELLCEPSAGKKRKTSFSAFAVRVGKFYVTVNSTFANQIFSAAIEKGAIGEFRRYVIAFREKRLGRGRIDFVLNDRKGRPVYVEVKSCTHVEHGVAKFPDRPTERGRQHLKLLSEFAARGKHCYIVFIVQRPDARRFSPFRAVDPAFADLLKYAQKAGVGIKVMATNFEPPNIYLSSENLPIDLD
ncbi:MAG: DNA/RNA nuclease SfsA [Candidatus Hadarchaeaceae archaeon]